jgi:ribulose-phosphate 3-epimerase
MLINPGYAFAKDEKQVSYADRKIRELRKMIDARGLDTKIEADGRISIQNIQDYGKHDVNIFVTGSTCLDKNDLAGSFKKLQELVKSM